VLMIYCDTDTFLNNIKRHEEEPRAQEELPALEPLSAGRGNGYSMYRSHVPYLSNANYRTRNREVLS